MYCIYPSHAGHNVAVAPGPRPPRACYRDREPSVLAPVQYNVAPDLATPLVLHIALRATEWHTSCGYITPA